jgi:HD-GYP domain-containing protein (c-di-GMP phosphodiesterase class II)
MVIREAAVAVSRHLVVHPGPASIGTAQQLAMMTVTEALESPESLQALVRLTYVTTELNKHFVNSFVYSMAICAAMGTDGSHDILATGLAGLLVDIGMAKLTQEAQAAALAGDESNPMIRQHVFVGRELLHEVRGMPAIVHDAALGHHERRDGSGYPSGLAGNDIPPAARIAAVVDVFDGLTTERSGRARLSSYQALKFIAQRMRGQFEPEIIDALILGLSG